MAICKPMALFNTLLLLFTLLFIALCAVKGRQAFGTVRFVHQLMQCVLFDCAA
jgi:hypothetical protein